ncbi:MAG: hypothetical protein ACF8R7_02615 [Phycisphaerales bacterium JB039]
MRRLALVPAAAALAAPCLAQDLFRIDVTPDDPGVLGVSAGDSSLPDLVESLLDTTGAFEPLTNQDFDATLRYAGVDDAIRFRLENNETRATLEFPSLGQTFVFDEADGDIQDQIEEFFKKDGAETLADFLKDMNRRSLVAVTDGNPLATTARSAWYKFGRFGIHSDMTLREKRAAAQPGAEAAMGVWRTNAQPADSDQPEPAPPEAPGPGAAGPGWFIPGSQTGLRARLDGRIGAISTDSGDATSASLAASGEWRFSRNVGLALSLPMSYHDVDGADVINAGLHLDIPIAIIVPTDSPDGFTWQITPGGLLAGSASIDMVAGGTFWGVGATNLFAYEHRGWTFSFATQFTHFDSIELTVDDYEFDPDLTQDVLINGAKVTAPLGDSAYAYGGLAYTDFLEEAAVDNYLTPMAGLGYRTPGGLDLRLGYEGDFGDGYEAHMLRVGLALPF